MKITSRLALYKASRRSSYREGDLVDLRESSGRIIRNLIFHVQTVVDHAFKGPYQACNLSTHYDSGFFLGPSFTGIALSRISPAQCPQTD